VETNVSPKKVLLSLQNLRNDNLLLESKFIHVEFCVFAESILESSNLIG